MSYILDALRRADAERERERGAVPGLHARNMAADAEPAARDFRPLIWAAGGAGARGGAGGGGGFAAGVGLDPQARRQRAADDGPGRDAGAAPRRAGPGRVAG